MTGRTHDVAAITALSLATLANPPESLTLTTAILALVANQLGGLTPDLDEPTAPFWRSNMLAGMVGRIVDKVLVGHRFISHSLIGAFGFGVLFWMLLEFIQPLFATANMEQVWWAYMLGILSHLVADSMTKEGIPWLLPLPWKLGFPPLKMLRITTGSWIEMLMVFPGLIALNIWLVLANADAYRH
jgi:inner membrane protein